MIPLLVVQLTIFFNNRLTLPSLSLFILVPCKWNPESFQAFTVYDQTASAGVPWWQHKKEWAERAWGGSNQMLDPQQGQARKQLSQQQTVASKGRVLGSLAPNGQNGGPIALHLESLGFLKYLFGLDLPRKA